MFCIWPECLLPYKALREEGQTTKNLRTLVELPHIRRCHHGDTMVVHDAEVVHTQTITHCKTIIKLDLLKMSNKKGKE